MLLIDYKSSLNFNSKLTSDPMSTPSFPMTSFKAAEASISPTTMPMVTEWYSLWSREIEGSELSKCIDLQFYIWVELLIPEVFELSDSALK